MRFFESFGHFKREPELPNVPLMQELTDDANAKKARGRLLKFGLRLRRVGSLQFRSRLKTMDSNEAIRFHGKVHSAALRKNASTQRAGAGSFNDMLYAEWKATGKPLDEAAAWLDQRLNDTFLFLKNPPVWVEDEPSWPFFEGKPMVFLSQTQMDSSPVSKSALSPGEMVYLFAARQKYKTGFKMHFEVVSQFAALKSRNG